MKKYMIERDLPGIGSFTAQQLREASANSCVALHQLYPDIQWQESYLGPDTTFCIYLATDESIIRRHSEISGIPFTRITEIVGRIDPTTATPL